MGSGTEHRNVADLWIFVDLCLTFYRSVQINFVCVCVCVSSDWLTTSVHECIFRRRPLFAWTRNCFLSRNPMSITEMARKIIVIFFNQRVGGCYRWTDRAILIGDSEKCEGTVKAVIRFYVATTCSTFFFFASVQLQISGENIHNIEQRKTVIRSHNPSD
jgi:hypothetical protein